MDTLRAKNRMPTHPGAILRKDVLPALGITQTELALRLGVSRRTISEVIHEKRPLTLDMAIRLARFLGSTSDSWINMQIVFDRWKLEHQNADIYDEIEKFG